MAVAPWAWQKSTVRPSKAVISMRPAASAGGGHAGVGGDRLADHADPLVDREQR